MARATARLRELIQTNRPVFVPDCNSALTARVLQKVGFQAGYAGGHSMGMMHYAIPDYGLLTTTEMVDQASRISGAVDIPIIFDADEFGGSVAGAYRSIPMYERAGAGGIHMEDEQLPKHSAWRGGLVSIEDMQARIAAAVAARTDPDFVILARSNELQNRAWYGDDAGNLDQMIKRGQAYAEAGADIFLANGAAIDQLDRIVKEVPIPISTYNTPRAAAEQHGVALVLYTGWATASAISAHRRWAKTLLETGELPPEAFGLEDKDELLGESVYSDLIRDWARSTGRPIVEGLAGH
jgi:2-methylisocitrate lyase-like PEP mutase family enzyme